MNLPIVRRSRWVTLPVAASRGVLSVAIAWAAGSVAQGIAGETPAQGRSIEKAVASGKPVHWAFVSPAPVVPPAVPSGVRSVNPIDAFISSQLQAKQITPGPAASRVDLLRRVTYDLTGLPPTPGEVDRFVSDVSPEAYVRVVDRLLASPQFGERWAQHWLDLAHYADSNGFELDADRPDAWRYRDWVVRAFNEDWPYDEFVRWQIAGDEVAPGNPEALVASGFGRSGPFEVVSGNIDPEVQRQNELTGVTSTVGSVFLGLTLGCARCHDHKFDPLTMADYYALQAYFAGARFGDIAIHAPAEVEQHRAETARIEALIKPLQEAKAKLEKPHRERLQRIREAGLTAEERAVRAKPKEQRTPEETRLFEGTSVALNLTWEAVAEAVAEHPEDFAARESIKRQISELQRQFPRPLSHAMAMVEGTNAVPETRLLRRGDPKSKLAVVEPAPPVVLCAAMEATASGSCEARRTPQRLDATHSGRRRALAEWMVAPNHPLTARVIVNRLWQHHFGRGLVATASDFGTHGDPPVNQALLDWLSQELLRQRWHLKALHRLMVLSETYQRASMGPSSSSLDPENVYLGRMNRRRMEAEGLRDTLLAAAGVLNGRRGGPGVYLPLEPEVESLIFTEAELVELWPVERDATEQCRRSIYVHRKRNVHYPLFDAFDAPSALTSCPVRPVSTHAPQALVLLNGEFAQQTAVSFARSLLELSARPEERIREAFRRCYARGPSVTEMRSAMEFVRVDGRSELDCWTDFTLALLNSNELAYVP